MNNCEKSKIESSDSLFYSAISPNHNNIQFPIIIFYLFYFILYFHGKCNLVNIVTVFTLSVFPQMLQPCLHLDYF